MKPRRSNTGLLAMVTGVLLIVVVIQRLGLFASEESAEAGVQEEYLDRAAAAAEDRVLLASADSWNQARDQARAAWAKAREGLIPAATVELAEALFREQVAAAMADIKLPAPARMSYVKETAPESKASRVQRITLRIEFDASSPKDAYAILDRLENLPDARTAITQVSVSGPGRVQLPEQVTVSVTLSAVAVIGEDA